MFEGDTWTVWVALAIILSLHEIFSPYSLTSSFSAGALVTALFSLFLSSIESQFVVFVLASSVFVVYRKPLMELIRGKPGLSGKDVDTPEGFEAVIEDAIEPELGVGKITVDGEEWFVFTEDQSPITKGMKVRVKTLSGTRLIVEPIK